jgi:hypothetical protein
MKDDTHDVYPNISDGGTLSAAERNWSTYSFIHSIKRNRLSSKRAEKLVAVHSTLFNLLIYVIVEIYHYYFYF